MLVLFGQERTLNGIYLFWVVICCLFAEKTESLTLWFFVFALN
uniref:Uncharacterized protein n=1 Tax=Rhizophora mucronata TaxID=61149 RepID=A0A2P2QB94_RHIMU